MQIHNTEIYHHGVIGMKWGKRKTQQIKNSNKEYKNKIAKIAKSKTAHKSDVKIAKLATGNPVIRLGKALGVSASTTLMSDILNGRLKDYDIGSPTFLQKKALDVGRNAVINVAANEVLARSVANKYDNNGNRIKGKNSSLFTREDVAKTALNTAIQVGPLIKTVGYLKMSQMYRQRTAGEEAFNKWGDNILPNKRSDYSNYVSNVDFKVT